MRVDRASLSRYLALKLHARGPATSQVHGNRRSAVKGRGVEFADYRAYDPGDDIRLVDWNVYLRLGVALVKQFTEERSLSLRICLDTSESMAFGSGTFDVVDPEDGAPDGGAPRPTALRKADHGAQLAAALAMVALGQREPVTLVCAGGDPPARRARAVTLDAMAEVLTLLEKVEPKGRGSLRSQLSAQLGQGRSDVLVLISDLLFEEAEREEVLRLCAASSHHPALVHLLGEDELNPDISEAMRVVDAETGEEIVVPAGARAAYDKALQAWFAAIEERCKRLGITYVRVPTTAPIDSVMYGSLHAGRLIEHRSGASR